MSNRPLATKISRALALIFRHCAATLVALMMALFGAKTSGAAVTLFVLGVGLDGLRHRYAPDFQHNHAAIAQSLARAVEGNGLKYHEAVCRRAIITIYIISITYTAIWVFVIPFGEVAQTYLRAFEPIHDMFCMFVAIIRRHTAELISHGYSDRALVAAHLYTVHFLTFIVATGTYLLGGSWHRAHILLARREALPSELRCKDKRRAGFHPLILLLITPVIYGTFQTLLNISWLPTGGVVWNIHESNIPFTMSFIVLAACAMLIGNSCGLIIIYLYADDNFKCIDG